MGPEQVVQVLIQSSLETLQDWRQCWEATAPVSHWPDGEQIFSLYPVWIALVSTSAHWLSLSHRAPLWRAWLCLLIALIAALVSLQSNPFSSLNKPQSLSLCSQDMYSSLWSFWCPSSELALVYQSLLWLGWRGIGCNIWDTIQQVLSRGNPLTSCLFFSSDNSRCCWLFHISQLSFQIAV